MMPTAWVAGRLRVLTLLSLGLLAALVNTSGVPLAHAAQPSAQRGIKVSGNALVAGDGQPMRLIGVNRSGAEYACIRGWGIFDGPADAASIQVISSWHANAVRVGLNEDCWLGINGVPPEYGGSKYQQAIIDYVNQLTENGAYAIVDLHWSAPGTAQATSLRPMPDADHSPAFWRSVAMAFADSPNVLFDVFNEPFGVDWDCWRDGCIYPGGPGTGPWQAIGMQSLVDTIRATGARQPILVGGLWFANDLTEWRTHAPTDPVGQLVASFHVYPFNACHDAACWNDVVAPLSEQVPVLVSEFGTDWTPPYSDAMAIDLMHWADDHQLGYLAWTWNTWGGGDALLTNYSGETTGWGADLKAHFLRLALPRVQQLNDANAAYAEHDMPTAIDRYQRVATTPPSDDESTSETVAIDGMARFRAAVGLMSIGEEEQAQRQLRLLADSNPGTPLAQLAAQFWDQYTMTASARAACTQLAPAVDSQAGGVLKTLQSLGITVHHDDFCVLPS